MTRIAFSRGCALLASLVPQGLCSPTSAPTTATYRSACGRRGATCAIASDIGREPLEHARRTAEEYGHRGIDLPAL